MRRAREGLPSLVMISRRRLEARGVMSMVISLPDESLRGLAVMAVAWERGVVEKGRRLEGLLGLRRDGGFDDLLDEKRADELIAGVRKSRRDGLPEAGRCRSWRRVVRFLLDFANGDFVVEARFTA